MATVKAIITGLLLLAPLLCAAQSALNGTWMAIKDDKSLDLASMVTYQVKRDAVEMSAASGLSYKARLTGADTPIAGDPLGNSMSVSMPGKNVLLETTKRDGKAWQTVRTEVGADGNTATVTWKNIKTDKSGSYEMSRQ